MPRVSVIITIYNPGSFLRPAVDSVLAQTFKDFELVAVENGSDDGAKEIMRTYAAKDVRVRLVDLAENIGRTPALNLALREAKGEYVAVLDADDITDPERLQRQVTLLEDRPDVVLVASSVRHIDEAGNITSSFSPPTDPKLLRDALAYSNPVPHSACMFRREAAVSCGGYPERYVYAQDFALWIALARRGELAMIGTPLAEVREHHSRATNSPVYAILRFREALELLRSVRDLRGLSPEARRRGDAERARLHEQFARQLMSNGQPTAALVELMRGFLVTPGPWLRRGLRRARRLFAMDPTVR